MTRRFSPATLRILGALADGPLSVNEITAKLRLEVWETWAEAEGVEVEWGSPSGGRGPNEPVGARLVAMASAERLGLVNLSDYQVYPRLRVLERRGEVMRLQLDGHRPTLWRLP